MQLVTSVGAGRAANRWPAALAGGLAKATGFIRKDLTIAVSYRLQFVFQFSQVFFGVAVIYFIGQIVGSNGTPATLVSYGADYFSFALVGLAVNSYLKTGLVTTTNNIRQMMNQGVLEVMCAGPIGYKWLLFCTTLWPFLFETLRVGFYFLLGAVVFGMRLPNANWIAVILTMCLTIPTFLLLGIISSSILIVVKRGDPINWLFSSISGLLAGTMFPIAVLPGWLQTVALYLPLTHSLEALRRCLLTAATLKDVWNHLLALSLFIVVLIPVTIIVNDACMAKAKRMGALSTH
jgi:ABC-2 type transport system permease protein